MTFFFQNPNQQSEDNDELAQAIKNGAFLVDVRTPDEFSGGSVVDAVNIPLNELEDRLEEFEDKEIIVVFCRSGARSETARQVLESSGFNHVLNGGSWQNVNRLRAELE